MILDALRDLRPKKPVVFAGLDEGAAIPATYVAGLRALGVPFFPSTERALRALGHVVRSAAHPRPAAHHLPQSHAIDLPSGTIPEYRAKAVLEAIGIPVPPRAFATSLEAALAAAPLIGYPLVLKAQSAALSHKTDAGGVVLNIQDDAELRTGWARLHAGVTAARPDITLDGILLEPMAPRGLELIVGGRNDPAWGPILLVGFGGVQAEVIQDIRLLPTGMTREAIIAELRQLKSAPLLDGFRGALPVDMVAIADIITAIGALLDGNPAILDVEINPVVAYSRGALALDALMIVGDASSAAESSTSSR